MSTALVVIDCRSLVLRRYVDRRRCEAVRILDDGYDETLAIIETMRVAGIRGFRFDQIEPPAGGA